MENQVLDNNFNPASDLKLYKDKGIWIATFLGGPLATGYILAENFKALGDTGKSKKTWIYTILISIFLFAVLISLPDSVRIPNWLIPIISIALAQFVLTRFQGEQIKKHIESGGQFFSGWKAALIGLISLLITLVIVIVIALGIDFFALAS